MDRAEQQGLYHRTPTTLDLARPEGLPPCGRYPRFVPARYAGGDHKVRILPTGSPGGIRTPGLLVRRVVEELLDVEN